MAKTIVLKKGEYLIRENDEGTEMYYIQEGALGVFKTKVGKESQIETLRSGEVVGEMSFLDESPRCASVKAMMDTVLVVVPRDSFEKFMETLPSWYRALLHTLLDRLRKANARIRV